jgi:hypothetical protein
VRPQVQHPERAPSQQLANCIRPVSALLLIGSAYIAAASERLPTWLWMHAASRSPIEPRGAAERVSLTVTVLSARIVLACVCVCVSISLNETTWQQSHIWFQEHQRECQRDAASHAPNWIYDFQSLHGLLSRHSSSFYISLDLSARHRVQQPLGSGLVASLNIPP